MSSFLDMNRNLSHKHHKKIVKTCEPLFDAFGFTSFFYQITKNDGNYTSVCTDIDLMDYYFIESKLFKSNPFITNSLNLVSGIHMQNILNDIDLKNDIFILESKFKTNYTCRLSHFSADGTCHVFGFGRKPNDSHIDNLIVNKIPLLRNFTSFFQGETKFMRTDLEDYCVNLNDSLKKSPQLNEFTNLKIKEDKFNILLKQLGVDPNIKKFKFSKQEVRCLKHFVKGYSASSIAEKLILSQRTVESYISNIKNKTGCNTKSELLDLLSKFENFGLYPEIFTDLN